MIIKFLQLFGLFLINFFIIDSFNVFSYSKVITLIQSPSLVYLIFNFEMYSFVIKIVIDVNKAVLLEIIIPAPGLIKPIVELPIAEPVPIASFNLLDQNDMKKCFTRVILEPMFFNENNKKKDKIDNRLYLIKEVKAKFFLNSNDQEGFNQDLH